MAGLINCLDEGVIERGQKVLILHTGGNTSLFAYQNKLATAIERVHAIG
jgi:1-aminocyclopropane-1-carboxylate deaminase/D-cysteine desulfhydrase-like pyridoxal-dependent ACC family enzyme